MNLSSMSLPSLAACNRIATPVARTSSTLRPLSVRTSARCTDAGGFRPRRVPYTISASASSAQPTDAPGPQPSSTALRWLAGAVLLAAPLLCARPSFAQQPPPPPITTTLVLPSPVSAPLVEQVQPQRRMSPDLLATIAASSSAFGSLTTALQEVALDRMAYAMQRLSTTHVFVKITVLFLAGIPLVWLFGNLYRKAAQIPMDEALYKCYALLYRVPGIGLAKENSPQAYVVANLVFFVGLFTFAILLGIVSDEVKTLIKNTRSGSYPVRQADHLLVLNWNAQTVPLLRQIAQAKATGNAFVNKPVVVLADKGKSEMDALIADGLRGFDLEVYTRKGSPMKMSDLRKVAAHKAKTVMLLHPSGDDAETLKAASAMCLTAIGSDKQQGVVVQMQSQVAEEEDVLQSLTRTSGATGRNFQLLQFPDKTVLSQFMTQTASQPGIVTVWLSILQQGRQGAQFMCVPVPDTLAGQTFGEIRRHYAKCVVCGFIAEESEAVQLNVPDSTVIQPGSSLVVLARRSKLQHSPTAMPCYEDAAKVAAERLKGGIGYQSKPKRVIVTGCDFRAAQELMPGFAEFAPSGSSVTFIVPELPTEGVPSRQGNVRFSWVTSSSPSSIKALSDAGIKNADSIVIGDKESLNDADADARVLASILQVQDATFRSKRKEAPHVIARIRKWHTAKLAQQYLSNLRNELAEEPQRAATVVNNPEFVIPNDIVSALLTQVAAEPGYSKIIRELLYSSTGQEIYLRNPAALNLPMGSPLTFADVQETARRVKWTALGLIRADGSCQLAPGAVQPVVLNDGDKIVVLAEEY